MSHSHDLHRALLRPSVLHILRAAGFHSTRPSVLDTLTNLAERHLLLLAASTAAAAALHHNDPVPTVADVRAALRDCGVLLPWKGGAEEGWVEGLRKGTAGDADGGHGADGVGAGQRAAGEKRKREDADVRDVREFAEWSDGAQMAEIRRVAGLVPDGSALAGAATAGAAPGAGAATAGAAAANAAATAAVVGVGGGVVQTEDWLSGLKKKYAGKGGGAGGEEGRLAGTVLGKSVVEDREVVIEGGPVGRLRDWRPSGQDKAGTARKSSAALDETMLGTAKDEESEDDRPLRELTAQT